jgi:6-phosphogluconolactonase
MIQLIVGSYTEPLDHVPGACGEGIYTYLFDPETGNLTPLNIFSGIRNPSYLAACRQTLYAVSEVPDGPGTVASLSIDTEGVREITSENTIPGRCGCHISCYENRVFAVSYMDGSLSVYHTDDREMVYDNSILYHGSGPNIERQASAHAHQAIISPDKRWLFVCDLGSDTIWRHALDRPIAVPDGEIKIEPGSGPRHICFHPSLHVAYLICELTGFVIIFAYDAAGGTLTRIGAIDSLPSGYTGRRGSAAIKVHPSANTLYVSNRVDNSFTVFGIGGSGKLTLIDILATEGDCPRDITFDRSGTWLIIAHQDSNTLTMFKINPDTGEPDGKAAHQQINCGTPVCLVFQETSQGGSGEQ